METASSYTVNAERIARELGLGIEIKKANPPKCPTWGGSGPADHPNRCGCGAVHGHHYRVTIRKEGRGRKVAADAWELSFDFWGSYADATAGAEPTAYDVLSCVSSDASMSTDPDEIFQEFGPMKPSEALATAEHARRLQGFFTEPELQALAEIQ